MIEVKIGSEVFYDLTIKSLQTGRVTPNGQKAAAALLGNFYHTVGNDFGSFRAAFKLYLHYNHPPLEEYDTRLIACNGSIVGGLLT